ncbi:hypothetical protein NOR_05134 [Metarhizium rileyi]|uniref:Uncharacterized protein n=1 Tax=Metarhizium rileyi (strain RCEF 4871) TaxID=1649241 RepID=A0A167CVI3_METRR|nr:hypothetical protein NOR_05134 [Metarhizium rileyi RCEF 4871]TWU73355.1 hypothetical protein ED733_000077 [Metarhizium rileyi]
MADILRFSAAITEETLIASARLLVYVYGRRPIADPGHFRLRLLHRHITIPEGQILLGTNLTEPFGFWTKPTPIPDIDLQKIYPHIISAQATSCKSEGERRSFTLFPSEFRGGPPVSVANIDGNFFIEFTDYLWANGLENTFGLEVIQGQDGKIIEFSFNIGSLLVKEEEVKAEVREEMRGQFMMQETGWSVSVKEGTVCKTGETQCWIYPPPTGHVKIINSKAKGVSEAIKILRNEGILAM